MDAPEYNPFPTGSRIQVWWSGDRQWYAARVTDTRIELHKIKGAQVPCHEIHCTYELDNHVQWHSLHNNKVRAYNSSGVCSHPATPLAEKPTSHISLPTSHMLTSHIP
eukprot:5459800-Prymnesium_polylepis.1